MRNILGFYRAKNALEKVKLWPFEKLPQILALFPKRPLIIAITSYVMILWPMFLYSFESWDHEDYFRLLQSSKRFRKSEVMTIWKVASDFPTFPSLFPVTHFLHILWNTPALRSKKNQPNRVLVYSLSLVTRHGLTDFFFSLRAGVLSLINI